MIFTGLTGVWPAALGAMSDADRSGLRVVPVQDFNGAGFTAGFSLSGQSATGSGTIMDSRAWGRGAAWVRISGNSASASILVSHDSAIWTPIWSAYTGQYTANNDNWVQIEEYYPFLRARVEFVSASGGVTAAVWLHMTRVD